RVIPKRLGPAYVRARVSQGGVEASCPLVCIVEVSCDLSLSGPPHTVPPHEAITINSSWLLDGETVAWSVTPPGEIVGPSTGPNVNVRSAGCGRVTVTGALVRNGQLVGCVATHEFVAAYPGDEVPL